MNNLRIDYQIEELHGKVKVLNESLNHEKEISIFDKKKQNQSISLLEGQIKSLNDYTKKLKKEISQLKSNNEEYHLKNEEYANTMQKVTENFEKAQSELERILDAYEELSQRNKDTENQLADVKEVNTYNENRN